METKILSFFDKCLVWFILIVFNVHIIGCTTLAPVSIEPESLEKEKVLHIELTSGEKIRLKDSKLENGFLVGLTPKYDTLSGPYEEIRISLDRIKLIQIERFSSKKTIITLTVVTIGIGVFLYYVTQFDLGLN